MENKLKKWMGLGLMMGLAFSAQAAKYTFKVANPQEGAKLTLTWTADGTVKTVALVHGEGTLEANGFAPQYATLKYGRYSRTLYLDPAQDLDIAFDAKTLYKAITIEGAGAAVNNYLNTSKFASLNFEHASREEEALLRSADSVYQANLSLLEAAGMPAGFAKQEKERLKYLSYKIFPMYQTYYRYFNKGNDNFVPSDKYYQKLEGLSTIDAALLACPGYSEFISNSIMARAFKHEGDKNKQFMDYVVANVNDQTVLDLVANSYIYNQVSNSGLEGAEELIDFYRQHVKDAALTKKFNDLCTKWEALKAGRPSPAFACPDIDGKVVSLADLKGKFVYIDVWATWCGPCRMEIPHLQKLEEAYAGKDIHFVSLSCDQDKSAWEKMLKAQKMGGIQLYMGAKDEFMGKYLISGIPRFILLDREGHIVKADAPRPSNPEIKKLFDELLAK